MGRSNLRRSIQLRFAFFFAATALLATPSQAATFTLGFDGVPAELGGSPGETVSFDAYVTLDVADNESPYGAVGWIYAVGVRRGGISAISVAGINVSTIYEEDHDRDESTPPILHDPYEQELADARGDGGISNAYICTATLGAEDMGRVGASAVILTGASGYKVLQPSGKQRIARITVESTVPLDGEMDDNCAPIELYFLDGADVICLDSFGRRVCCANSTPLVTHEGQSGPPQLDLASTRVCVTRFRRGDVTADARVDISDAISALNFLFLGGPAPICRDAADASNDAALDLTDPILILTRLFSGASTTAIPSPGIYNCGTDTEPDELSCATSAGS